MATGKGQRVAAFLLALMFLATTLGAAGYVIYQLRTESTGLVDETPVDTTQSEDTADTCGQGTMTPVEPRAVPEVTTAETPVTELQTIDIVVGDGAEVQPGDCVGALYYGTLATTGEKFDGNYETGQPIEFSLDGVIPGWTQGIPGMKVGGVRRLVIPAELAYGAQANGGIPANSDLVFEVHIVSTREAN